MIKVIDDFFSSMSIRLLLKIQITPHKKRSFPLTISSVYVNGHSQFTEEILNGKLHFLCSVIKVNP